MVDLLICRLPWRPAAAAAALVLGLASATVGAPTALAQENAAGASRMAPGEAQAMLAIWNEVKDSGDVEALDAFAAAFAGTPLAPLARNRAAALRAQAAESPPSGAEPIPSPAPASPEQAAADAAARAATAAASSDAYAAAAEAAAAAAQEAEIAPVSPDADAASLDSAPDTEPAPGSDPLGLFEPSSTEFGEPDPFTQEIIAALEAAARGEPFVSSGEGAPAPFDPIAPAAPDAPSAVAPLPAPDAAETDAETVVAAPPAEPPSIDLREGSDPTRPWPESFGAPPEADGAEGAEGEPEPEAVAAPTPAAQPAQPADDRAARRDQYRQAQRLLNRAGYDAGVVDGVWGRRSAAALAAFSRTANLPADGVLTDRHLRALRAAPPRPRPPAPPRERRPTIAATPGAPPPPRPVERRMAQITFEMHRVGGGRRVCGTAAPLEPDGGLNAVDIRLPECGNDGLTAQLVVAPSGQIIRGRVTFNRIFSADLNGTRWRFSGSTDWRRQRGDTSRIIAIVRIDG